MRRTNFRGAAAGLLAAGVAFFAAGVCPAQDAAERGDKADAKQAEKGDDAKSESAQTEKRASHSGEFVKTGDGQFTMSINGKNQHSHKVTDATRVMLNGKRAKLADLKTGDSLEVTTNQKNVALMIKATRNGEQPKRDAPKRAARRNDGDHSRDQDDPRDRRGDRDNDRDRSRDLDDDGRRDRKARENRESDRDRSRDQDWDARFDVQDRRGDRDDDLDRSRDVGDDRRDNRRQGILGVRIEQAQNQNGAQVVGVIVGGPAYRAGVRAGDRIISLDGNDVESPDTILDWMKDSRAGQKTKLKVMRGDREMAFTATLGEPFAAGFRGDRQPRDRDNARDVNGAWLGVGLADTDDRGARIAEVFEDGPASRAGLRSGDVILQVGEAKIESAEDAGNAIRKMEPGKEVQVRIMRNEEERTMKAELGRRRDFQAEGVPGFGDGFPFLPPREFRQPGRPGFPGRQRGAESERIRELEQSVEELRRDLNELRKQVQPDGAGETERDANRDAPRTRSDNDRPDRSN